MRIEFIYMCKGIVEWLPLLNIVLNSTKWKCTAFQGTILETLKHT